MAIPLFSWRRDAAGEEAAILRLPSAFLRDGPLASRRVLPGECTKLAGLPSALFSKPESQRQR